MKLWLRRIHLLLALISGLFLLILSLTGAFLIYANDIQYYFQPDKWQVSNKTIVLNPSALISTVQAQTDSKIVRYMPQENVNAAWPVRLQDGTNANVNPYTGQVIYRYESTDTLYGFTLALHRWLLLENDKGDKPLKNWVSICALLLIINALVGFYLWVKPKNRLKRLAIKPKAKFRVLMYQLHTVAGVYVLIPLILIAFTGMAFNWKNATQLVLETAMFSQIEQRPKTPQIEPQPGNYIDYDSAINNALSVFPNGSLYRIYLPKKSTDPIALRIQNLGESHAYSWVWVNPFTAKVLDFYDASKANFVTQTWNFKYKFHTGNFAGPIVNFLWLFIVFSLSFFIISGIYFWAKRHKWM